MPLYKNTTTERVSLAGMLLDPGEAKAIESWISPLPAGIVKLSDSPMYNPVIYAAKHNAAGTITIPTGETRFNIHIAVTSGEVTVYFSSGSNTPPLVLYNGARWNIKCFERAINDIRLSSAGVFEAYVIIERF